MSRSAARSGFTIIELLVVVALIGMLSSVILVMLTGLREDARDTRRVADLAQLEKGLELYYTDHQHYPKESDGANGDVSMNAVFQSLVGQYLQGIPHDPAGLGNATFYYYYDGRAQCGNRYYAIIFARQMDRGANGNYALFLAEACNAILDGEGRGGGTESYNIRLGESGG